MAYGYNGFGNYSYPFPQNNDPWRQSMYAQIGFIAEGIFSLKI